jgi:uncharacterized protein
MRNRFFGLLTLLATRHPGKTLIGASILTAVMFFFASHLSMRMTWFDMVPQKEPVSKSYRQIIQDFEGAINMIMIAVEGDRRDSLLGIGAEVETALHPLIEEHKVRRISWKYPLSFFREHGLMLTEAKDLEKIVPMIGDFNLVPFLSAYNDNLEKTYVGDEEKLSTNERTATTSLDAIDKWITGLTGALTSAVPDTLAVRHSLDRFWVGDDVFISPDNTMLLLTLQPWMTVDSVKQTVALANTIDSLLAPVKKAHPGYSIRATGMHMVARDEMNAASSDSIVTTLLAFAAILALIVFAFRMKSAPLICGTALVVGIIWAMGIAGITIGRLNMMTVFCSLYLVGLGIDFSIHLLSGYNEQKRISKTLEEALSGAFATSGRGIVTGSLTTAIAFFALVFTDFDVFRELGFIAGTGVLSCLLSTLIIMPAILILKDRRAQKKGTYRIPPEQATQSVLLGNYGNMIFRKPLFPLIGILIVSCIAVYFALNKTWFDPNFMHEEAKGLESVELQEDIVKKFNLSDQTAVFTVPDLDSAWRITDFLDDQKTVAMVESPVNYCPPQNIQRKRRPLLEKIRTMTDSTTPAKPLVPGELKSEIERLEANIIEMSQSAYQSLLDRIVSRADRMTGLDSLGNKVAPGIFTPLLALLDSLPEGLVVERMTAYQNLFRSYSRVIVNTMANPETITWNMVPREFSEGLISTDGASYLITVFPKSYIWDELDNSPFLRMLDDAVPEYTGMAPLMYVLYDRGRSEGRRAVLYALIAVFVLLLIDFRSLKFTIFAMLPLFFAALFLVGGYGLTGAPFNLMNIMAVPLILGIGIDDGVHLCHRFRHDPTKPLRLQIGSAGRAVFLTSATTMIAFGSLCFATMQGNVHLGQALFFGVGLCFVMTITIFPMVISFFNHPDNRAPQTTDSSVKGGKHA